MQQSILAQTGQTLSDILGSRKVRNILTLILVGMAPVLILLTFVVLGGFDSSNNPLILRAIILVDIVYVITVAGLIAGRIARMVSARRARSAGSDNRSARVSLIDSTVG